MTTKRAASIAFEIAAIAILVCVLASVVALMHRRAEEARAHQAHAVVRPLPKRWAL